MDNILYLKLKINIEKISLKITLNKVYQLIKD